MTSSSLDVAMTMTSFHSEIDMEDICNSDFGCFQYVYTLACTTDIFCIDHVILENQNFAGSETNLKDRLVDQV